MTVILKSILNKYKHCFLGAPSAANSGFLLAILLGNRCRVTIGTPLSVMPTRHRHQVCRRRLCLQNTDIRYADVGYAYRTPTRDMPMSVMPIGHRLQAVRCRYAYKTPTSGMPISVMPIEYRHQVHRSLSIMPRSVVMRYAYKIYIKCVCVYVRVCDTPIDHYMNVKCLSINDKVQRICKYGR